MAATCPLNDVCARPKSASISGKNERRNWKADSDCIYSDTDVLPNSMTRATTHTQKMSQTRLLRTSCHIKGLRLAYWRMNTEVKTTKQCFTHLEFLGFYPSLLYAQHGACCRPLSVCPSLPAAGYGRPM